MLQPVARHLRISGEQPIEIDSVSFLKPRYVRALGRAAETPDMLNSTIVKRLYAAREGELLLLPQSMEGLDGEDNISAELTLEKNDTGDIATLGATRRESCRGVRFGQMLFSGSVTGLAQEYVAVKPTRIERAVREAAAAAMINDSDNVATYQPLGFIKTSEQNVGLFTRYKPNTLTLDNVLWAESDAVTDEQISDALAKSALSLATIHGLFRLTHGDAQPKNMAWDYENDQPWVVDLEDSTRHILDRSWDFSDDAEVDIATLLLFQPVRRSRDMHELVANVYIDKYKEITNDERPVVDKDAILRMYHRTLQPLPRKAFTTY